MSTSLNDIVAIIVSDFTVGGVEYFSTAEVMSKARFALPILNADLNTGYTIDDSAPATPMVNPTMTGLYYEAYMLLIKSKLCSNLMISSASGIKFKSADKESDRTKVYSNWAGLYSSWQAAYNEIVLRLNPVLNAFDATQAFGTYRTGYDKEDEIIGDGTNN